jgi:multicomponent Na+:H+ antiporter subunit D
VQPWNLRAARVIFAATSIFFGLFPGPLYALLPSPGEATAYLVKVYTLEHVMGMLGLLAFSGLAFFMLLPLLKRTETITLDVDWIWRRFVPSVWREVVMPIVRGLDAAQKAVLEKLPGRGVGGEPRSPLTRLGAEWAVSVPVFLVTAMLVIYLVVYFVLMPTH